MKASISQIKCFKGCRRAYYFRYLEGLEPVEKADCLNVGTSYHEMVEKINNAGTIDVLEDEPASKEKAMATAYFKYIYPQIADSAIESEKWFECPLNERHTLIGRVDGIRADKSLIEHKTTSMEITPQYEYNLMWDEQILAYMLAMSTRKIYYTVCRKPTIRQKKNESDEEFFNRILEWYEEDTDTKIRLLEITRTNEEVNAFYQDLISICDEMEETTRLYRNCERCNQWGGRCEYSSICLNYDSNQEYIEFKRRENTR